MTSTARDLIEAVAQNPFPDYQQWWPMGRHFAAFMSQSIAGEWRALAGKRGTLNAVRHYCAQYVHLVYGRQAREDLVQDFVEETFAQPLQSGEFDALSYAFFRAAFERIAAQGAHDDGLESERRLFTKRVGRRFFQQVQAHLALDLPVELLQPAQLAQLKASIARVGAFLVEEGYLRDHFDFSFDVEVQYGGTRIAQQDAQFLAHLHREGLAYALYEMGYPVILPSAVYLYKIVGEAQHHSSRTIEELFERVGYVARETDEFDPGEHPSQRVVELWQIRRRR